MSLKWVPNAICLLRIVLVAPLVALLVAERYEHALVLFVVAGGSDALDGYLAKRFGWSTRLGGLLDPAADKLLVVSVFLTLTWLGIVPWMLAVVVVLRDVVIVTGAAAYHLLIEPLRVRPAVISKLNTACQLAFVLFVLTQGAFGWPVQPVLELLGAAVVFTSITSGLNYVLWGGRRAWRAAHAGP